MTRPVRYPTCAREAERHRLEADGTDRPTWASTANGLLSRRGAVSLQVDQR